MISFSHSRPNLNVPNSTEDNSKHNINNYESLEYEASKYKQLNNKYSQEKDTFDLYSYQDNNNIYVEEDEEDQIKPLSKPKENVDYIKVTPLVTNNDNIKYVVDLNDLRNHLNVNPIIQSQTLNRYNQSHQQQQHYLNHDSLTLNPQMLRMNANSTTLPNQSQQHLYHETQSLIPTLNRLNNSAIINQPVYQKSIDNLTLKSGNQLDLSKDTQSMNQTINRSAYYYSSKSELNKGEPTTTNVTTNKIQLGGSSMGCCRLFCSIIHFIFSCFHCFSCCFKPFCSMAALVAVLSILSSALVGLMFAASQGYVKLPAELTKPICNCDLNRTCFDYSDNHTAFNVSKERVFETNNLTNLDIHYSNNYNNFMNTTHLTNLTLTSPATSTKNNTAILIASHKKKTRFEKKIKSQNKLKNRQSKFVPLQYDVVFVPNFAEFNFDKNSYAGIEMKISMSIKLYCSNATNVLKLSTREFSTVEFNLENIDEKSSLTVKKWSHDSATKILEIETNRNFTTNNMYKLSVVIVYKNYGASSVLNNEKLHNQFFYLSFNEKFENPFPVVIESNNQLTTFSGPSVFNISLVKPKFQTQTVIFNTDKQRTTKLNNSIELINFKLTPFVPIQTISLILGNLTCLQKNNDEDLMKIKICSTYKSSDLLSGSFSMILSSIERLLGFFEEYTESEYPLKKIELIILPSESIIELANDDQTHAQLGIIYLPEFYIRNYNSTDQLEKEQVTLKIVHTISKQLSKHWFYKYQDCHNLMNLYKDLNENDFTVDTHYLVKSLCADNKNHTFCSNKDLAQQDQSFNAFLQYNVNCYLFKGIVNWISYLSFKSINPNLSDLIFLEWSLIRELDETYFFSNSNVKYVYQAYDFPRLTESKSLLKIKTEIKGLLSARTIYLLFGKDRFKKFITEWFTMMQTNVKSIDENLMFTLNQTKKLDSKLLVNDKENSILESVEKYSSQYKIISLPRVEFKDVIRSWILAPNNIVVSLTRNYNKKDALLYLDYSNNSIINDVYFPLNWLSGILKTNDDLRKVEIINPIDEENFNVKWINQSNDKIREVPGADKWLVGNYMKMFGQLRINYDEQNWLMLIKQLYYHHKSLSVSDRVQIIDDAFYLANNQKMSITYALNILEYIQKEDNFLPWKYLVKNIKNIISYIEDDIQIYSKFRNYIIKSMEPNYKKFRWGSGYDTTDEKLIRVLVVDLLCSLDYEDCKENSVKQVSDGMKIRVYNIPQYLSRSIYCTAIRNTGIQEWLYVWDYYLQQQDDSILKDNLLYSLTCSSHIWILNLFLRKLVYENAVPVENLPIIFDYISQNPVGKYIAWNHISQNYQTFYNKIGNDPDLFLNVLQVSTKELKFKYEIKQLYDFIDEISSKNITLYYSKNYKEKLLSNIETRINKYSKWKNANANELNEWLTARKVPEIPDYDQSK